MDKKEAVKEFESMLQHEEERLQYVWTKETIESLEVAIRELKKPGAKACCIDIDKKMVYTFCCGVECNDWSECQGKKYWNEYFEG